MLDSAIKINLLLVQYCRMLLDGIADERMTEQPLPGVNHPAWVLGHLALTTDNALGWLGAEKALPPEWAALFGAGSKPTASRGDYPAKEELVRAVEQGFERVRQRVQAAPPEQLARPTTHPRMRETLPTVKDGVAFLLTGHLGVHLGQLSTWRRMIGLPPLF
ncbi:MAG TPA: DinB family protein [Gemmataceae bacterium]|nr:DinB family protein [Gemmataceae bacterium]